MNFVMTIALSFAAKSARRFGTATLALTSSRRRGDGVPFLCCGEYGAANRVCRLVGVIGDLE
jgi:hypothetical protein